MNLTIIIPTLGRMDLLVRLIDYYHSVKFKGRIVIGDGSVLADYERANKALGPYMKYIQIRHLYLPNSSVSDAVYAANEYIETDYVCLVGDDDFIVPSTAANCIRFLESNEEYVAAHGLGVLVGAGNGTAKKIDHAHYYQQPVREENSAMDRLRAHLEDYSVSLFSVHRIDIWKRMFSAYRHESAMTICDDKTFSAELLPCCMSVAMGKVGQVEGLYLVRQVHDRRYILSSWFQWLKSNKWQPSYTHFRKQLSIIITDLDGINEMEALDNVDVSFSAYLKKHISGRPDNRRNIFKQKIRKIPLATSVWQILKSLAPSTNNSDNVSIAGLTYKSSRYFHDFQEVLNSILPKQEK